MERSRAMTSSVHRFRQGDNFRRPALRRVGAEGVPNNAVEHLDVPPLEERATLLADLARVPASFSHQISMRRISLAAWLSQQAFLPQRSVLRTLWYLIKSCQ